MANLLTHLLRAATALPRRLLRSLRPATMGNNAPTGSVFNDPVAVQRALDIARNTEAADLDPAVSNLLQRALAETWQRIRAQPDHYILTGAEFAVFNFYRHQHADSELAQSAISRFWNNYTGAPSAVNGP